MFNLKKTIYVIGICLLVFCNVTNGQNKIKTDRTDITKNNIIKKNKVKFNLNGTWALTNYFDSIIVNKQLAKFRLQRPTWFAILLEIKNDSIKTYGSIDYDEHLINIKNDTLTILSPSISDDKWYLIVKDQKLVLVQYPNSEENDSNVYIYKKRTDLNYFTKKNKDFFVIGENTTNYFNKHLFAGKYVNEKTNQIVEFKNNGKLTGINGFDSYEVRNYFGTLHPHKNLDVVTFFNTKTNDYKQYNWVFSNKELTLTEFIYEKISYDSETYNGDNMILGEEKIKLKNH